jgi:hypothetical protein
MDAHAGKGILNGPFLHSRDVPVLLLSGLRRAGVYRGLDSDRFDQEDSADDPPRMWRDFYFWELGIRNWE